MILAQQFPSFVLCVAFALYVLWFRGLSEHENEGNMYIARKVSKYGFFSGPYFTVLGLNTGKYRPEKTPYLDTFDGGIFNLPLIFSVLMEAEMSLFSISSRNSYRKNRNNITS